MFLLDRTRNSLEDLREISQAAQEAKLDGELARFEEELELFLSDKETFLEDLYRRLNQISSRWKSWRCQRVRDITIGQIVSRKQLEDLIRWEQELDTKKTPPTKFGVREKPVDVLVRFVQACIESKELYKHFYWSIYKPLHLLFEDERTFPLARALGRVLKKWKSLLDPGPVNHRMLSGQSGDVVHKNKPRSTKFDLLLRLIPDYAVKGYEALFLAKKWRRLLGGSGYIRELKRINRNNMALKSKPEEWHFKQPCDSAIPHATVKRLESKLPWSTETVSTLGHVKANGCVIDRSGKKGIKEADVNTGSSFWKEIDFLHAKLKDEQLSVQRIRARLLQGEFLGKGKTLMNVPLTEKLAIAKGNLRRLRNEISRWPLDYTRGSQQLPVARETLNSTWSVKTESGSFVSERVAVSRPLLKSPHRRVRT